MSFILDALKKSENERQRQSGPAFAEVPMAHPRTRQPWWVFAVAALLLVNLLVLLFVLLGRESAPAPASAPPLAAQPPPAAPPPAESAVAPASRTVDPVVAPPSEPARAARVEPNRAQAAPAVRENPRETPAPSRAEPGRSLAAAAGLDEGYAELEPTLAYDDRAVAATLPAGPPIVQPLASRPEPREEPAEALPTVNDLRLSGSGSFPEMHLDIHVYAPLPADRFVFINMRKYVEGQKLQEGPLVERITSDGVVLNQQGLRFLLPNQ
ncbi:MAG TPA: general secretion pathway protein GspB [Steroidobacteraceae bacterium]|nr:general secretion pathway protein GspB [Steroidobacteraceae bacterium]